MRRVTTAELEQQAPASEVGILIAFSVVLVTETSYQRESRLLFDLSLVTSSSGPIVWKFSELGPVFAS